MNCVYVTEGRKVGLRPMTIEDCGDIVRWRNSERVRSRYIYREDFTLEGERAYYRNEVASGHVIFLMICEKAAGGRAVGSVIFNSPDPEHNRIESGLFIGEDDALGKGLGGEAFRLGTRYVFAHWPFAEQCEGETDGVTGEGKTIETAGQKPDERPVKTLISRIFTDNPASYRTHEQAGYKMIRVLKDVRCTDGTVKDMFEMHLTERDLIC